jgi:hypothetical protein
MTNSKISASRHNISKLLKSKDMERSLNAAGEKQTLCANILNDITADFSPDTMESRKQWIAFAKHRKNALLTKNRAKLPL